MRLAVPLQWRGVNPSQDFALIALVRSS
jgi:hypothetical protein